MGKHIEDRLQAMDAERRASAVRLEGKHDLSDGWTLRRLSDGALTLEKDGQERLIGAAGAEMLRTSAGLAEGDHDLGDGWTLQLMPEGEMVLQTDGQDLLIGAESATRLRAALTL